MGCIALCSISCSKLPDNVLNKKDMTSLLVDIHKGESVVELQRGYFPSDSMIKMVKQSILQKHGVSQAQLDTSFVWYGNHIEDYIEIYDEVIANLEEDLKSVKGCSAEVACMVKMLPQPIIPTLSIKRQLLF